MNGLKFLLGGIAAIGTFYSLKRRSDHKLKIDELKHKIRLEDIDDHYQDKMRKKMWSRIGDKDLTEEEMSDAYKMYSLGYDSGF